MFLQRFCDLRSFLPMLHMHCPAWQLCPTVGFLHVRVSNFPRILLAMFEMVTQVGFIGGVQIGPVSNDKKILCVGFFCAAGEIETARDEREPVDEDHLVVRDGMLGIDQGGDAGVDEKVSRRILLCLLASIQDGENRDASIMCFDARCGYRFGSERIGLNEDLALRLVEFIDDSGSAAT